MMNKDFNQGVLMMNKDNMIKITDEELDTLKVFNPLFRDMLKDAFDEYTYEEFARLADDHNDGYYTSSVEGLGMVSAGEDFITEYVGSDNDMITVMSDYIYCDWYDKMIADPDIDTTVEDWQDDYVHHESIHQSVILAIATIMDDALGNIGWWSQKAILAEQERGYTEALDYLDVAISKMTPSDYNNYVDHALGRLDSDRFSVTVDDFVSDDACSGEIQDWLHNNIGFNNIGWKYGYVSFRFTDEADAMAFKLRWL